MGNRKGAHHRGSHQVRARAIVAAANADPTTKCGRCGKTLAEHRPHRNGTAARWDAGHVHDGQVGGPLRPEASTCNRSAGASKGNQLRRGLKTTRDW